MICWVAVKFSGSAAGVSSAGASGVSVVSAGSVVWVSSAGAVVSAGVVAGAAAQAAMDRTITAASRSASIFFILIFLLIKFEFVQQLTGVLHRMFSFYGVSAQKNSGQICDYL